MKGLARTVEGVLGLVLVCAACRSSGSCLDFDDLSAGTRFNNGTSFSTSGRQVDVGDFQWTDGTWHQAGHVEATTSGHAGGSGTDLRLNNANGDFRLGSASEIELRFADLGGNSNVRVNGDFRNVGRLVDADGSTLGGARVRFAATRSGNDWTGTMTVSGFVTQFALGGQELWIDDLCADRAGACVRFEDATPGSTYTVGQTLVSSGVDVVVERYLLPDDSWTSGGEARVDPPSHSGGSGNDVNTSNVNLAFQLAFPVTAVHAKFGELGGNVNLRINGDHRRATDLEHLHGTTVGGAAVQVFTMPTRGGVTGVVLVRGEITDFAIGGQELWIDDVCYLH